MSLKSKLTISFLVVVGSFVPYVVYSAERPIPASVQPSMQRPNVQPSTQLSEQPDVQAQPSAQAKTRNFSWAGQYMGIYAGGAWGHSRLNSNAGAVTSTSYFTSTADIRSINQNATGTVLPSAAIGGIQFGNNVQSNHTVYGIVLDYGAFRLNRSKNASNITYPAIAAQYSLKSSIRTSWLASLRARLGLTPPASWALFYLTGGIAITDLEASNAFSDNAASLGVGGGSETKVKAGWVVGAGIEVPVGINWTMEGEYQFVNFGSNAANGFITCRVGTCAGIRSPFSTAANLSESVIRLGLNYKF